MDKDEKFVTCLADIGLDLVSYGADVKRVEDTIGRMAKAYGAKESHILAISSSIFLTVVTKDGIEHTRTRRVAYSDNDFMKLEVVNQLARSYCLNELTVDELNDELMDVRNYKPNIFYSYLGSALGAGGFTMFFGGNLLDGLVGSLLGLVVCFLRNMETKMPIKSTIIYRFLLALVMGIMIQNVAMFIPIKSEMVTIGIIMLLIPGLLLTNSIKDIFGGDTITGLLRFVESLVLSVALGLGFMLAVLLFK